MFVALLSLFKSTSPIFNSSVTLPNGESIVNTHIGSIELFDHFVLENVLNVYQFRFNLLLVSALTQSHRCFVQFDSKSCFIQDHLQGKMIGMGKRRGNLYILDPANLFPILGVCNNVSKKEHEVWHSRLGHPSYVRLNVLKNVLHFKQLLNETPHCSICHLAKQKCLPFPNSNSVSISAFELLHLDIWGAFHLPTHDGFRYFFTIVDDFTRFTWVYLLRAKSDVANIFPAFYNIVYTQYGVKIKLVRSDNALEVAFTDFFRDKGILSFYSCVDTPQQNSVVERKHLHLLNVAGALLFQSHIPLAYWGGCILIAACLINRIPSLVLSNKTPFEVLYHKVPSYNHLRTFGCLCYGSTLTRHRDKFSPKAIQSVFLG